MGILFRPYFIIHHSQLRFNISQSLFFSEIEVWLLRWYQAEAHENKFGMMHFY
jgi:hypothetical protein